MGQEKYTEAWKKLLRRTSREISNGVVKKTVAAETITENGARTNSGYDGRLECWGGRCVYNTNSAPFRDLRDVYETGSEMTNRFPGLLSVLLRDQKITITHRLLTYGDYIERYKNEQMPLNLKEERYKWELIQSFQDKWNSYKAGQLNFAEVLRPANFSNLLYLGLVPTVFAHFLRDNPQAFEKILENLYDESVPLQSRIMRYLDDFKAAYYSLENHGPKTGQDERTIATLLTFRYPDKYTLFKYGFYAPLSKSFGTKPKDPNQQLLHYYTVVDGLLKELKNHPEIFAWEQSNLGQNCYRDDNHLILAQDIFYTLLDDRKAEPETTPEESHEEATETENTETMSGNYPLNLILYGPPGTGKTFHAIYHALAIIENKTVESLKAEPFDNVQNRFRGLLLKDTAQQNSKAKIGFVTFHQSMSYEDFIEGIKPVLQENTAGSLSYAVKPGIFSRICELAAAEPAKPYVLIIDEINRGNVAQVFGELITLIEPTKRKGAKEELGALLPYSKRFFGVPSNLYIIGTMNTADRSVEALDTALRRRFAFKEMLPEEQHPAIQTVDINGASYDFRQVLATMNRRLEKLSGRDHKIGHSYFMAPETATWVFYRDAFHEKIIPLLQEYFFGDYAKMCLVAGSGFVSLLAPDEGSNNDKFFADAEHDALEDLLDKKVWVVNHIETEEAFQNALDKLLNK